ncbi:MAG: phosphoribosyltransferase, partial [Solirubrobacterales bacterium]|nr:phosphoribosyltransferase [Solirubrobacterales bacterium]
MRFDTRRDAGRQLVLLLRPLAAETPVPVVVGLARGGVPVAFEIAQALGAPLDVMVVRKLGAPANPELGVGAIAEDGVRILDGSMARAVGMTRELLDATVNREEEELQRRIARYRGDRDPLDVHERTVVVVDDGLATGLTMLAAIRTLRRRGAARVVVAVPVGAGDSLERARKEADDVVCLSTPPDFGGVGRWYRDFDPVPDAEVAALLAAPPGRVPAPEAVPRSHEVSAGEATMTGDLTVPEYPIGLVIFAHGSGSSRFSPRNRAVAASLQRAGMATLLLDLLIPAEEGRREVTFDIPLLADRLEAATHWAHEQPATGELPIGYFGASTGAAAALVAAAAAGRGVAAVVSRGGRP